MKGQHGTRRKEAVLEGKRQYYKERDSTRRKETVLEAKRQYSKERGSTTRKETVLEAKRQYSKEKGSTRRKEAILEEEEAVVEGAVAVLDGAAESAFVAIMTSLSVVALLLAVATSSNSSSLGGATDIRIHVIEKITSGRQNKVAFPACTVVLLPDPGLNSLPKGIEMVHMALPRIDRKNKVRYGPKIQPQLTEP
jgi:hypothetical protein